MHILLTIPFLNHRSHYGQSIGQFVTEHERQGNLVFDVKPGHRRWVPRAMCIIDEYTDERWAEMEEAEHKAAAELKAKEEAEAKAKADAEAKAQAALDAYLALPWWKRAFAQDPREEVRA